MTIQDLSPLLKKYSSVQLVYLFGSKARGDSKELSDVDIAYYSKSDLPVDQEARLARELSENFRSTKVDLVNIAKASIVLQHEVVSEGKIIYQNISDDQVNQFEMKVCREYFDTEYIRKMEWEYLKEDYGV